MIYKVSSLMSCVGNLSNYMFTKKLGTKSPTANSGVLLLQETRLENAVAVCKSLGETLWGNDQHTAEIIQSNLDYLVYEKHFDSSQSFWIAPYGRIPRTVSATGKISTSITPLASLPVLCTQTAPFSSSTYQNNGSQWQVTVRSNNEYLTGWVNMGFNATRAPLIN
jgi:hypothetical protein